MATVEDLKNQFPEFAKTGEILLQAMLAAAELEIDRVTWGAKADQGQMLLAAHKLALSPMGNNAKMVIKNVANTPHGSTTYGQHYDTLVVQVGHGAFVA